MSARERVPPPRERMPSADLVLALVLFALLTAVSWRRWASLHGDLNREWSTPARLAAGERLYRDVAFYYGPLAPYAEAAAMRLFGARVGTAIGFGIFTAAATLAALLLATRRLLPPLARCAVACVAVGVLAFAPENGAFIACYSQSALMAVGLSWLSLWLAASGRSSAAAVAGGMALLAKPESAPALLGPLLLLESRARLRFVAIGGGLALAGYAIALAGIPLEELIRYGPLRHLRMPPEFAELYRRVSGLHPSLLPRALAGAVAGAALLGGWLLLSRALGVKSAWAAAGGVLLLAGAVMLRSSQEPLLTTAVRGLPLLCLFCLSLALPLSLRGERLPLAAAIVGLAFAWRTFLWTVPVFSYAPLAALSLLPAAGWLALRAAAAQPTALLVALLPFLASPLLAFPRLYEFYRSPRYEVVAPRGTWLPPGLEGALFLELVRHLEKVGVKDRSLVALPEASAVNFLMGVRSPLRVEQLLPGLFDDGADADAVARLEALRPERVVWVKRPFTEYGGAEPGRDYAKKLAAAIARDYRFELRLRGGGQEATVLRRR